MKKIVFMGTPDIAVPSLKALVENGFDIPLVITQPDKPKGRGQAVQFPPVKEYALTAGLEVYQPEKIKNNTEVMEKLKSISPDFFAVVAYGKILPQVVLDIPKTAPINVHFSLLPKYRGPAPVNWAIMNGEEETGVDIEVIELLGICDHIVPNEKVHWVSPAYLCKITKGEPTIMEPKKHTDMKWFSLEQLPQNLTITTKNALECYKKYKK